MFSVQKNKASWHHLDYLFGVYYTLGNQSGFSRKIILNKSVSFVLLESDTLLHIHEDLIKKKKKAKSRPIWQINIRVDQMLPLLF